MDNAKAISILQRLALDREELKKIIDRKRSWRDSEKAMSIVTYNEQIAAIDLAVKALKGDSNDG